MREVAHEEQTKTMTLLNEGRGAFVFFMSHKSFYLTNCSFLRGHVRLVCGLTDHTIIDNYAKDGGPGEV